MPLRRREARQQIANLRGERRRADRLGEDAEPGALERLLRGQRGADRAEKRRPRADLAEIGERLRAVGIVEPENRGLREHVGRAEAARMQRVAFDLGRPPFVALDEEPGGDAAERHRGRVEERLAGDELFGLAHVGNDLSGGWRVQAVTPASASDAPISLRNVRRATGSVIASICDGNSL